MTQQIMALCGAMGASEDRVELLLPLIQAVRDQLASRLRDGVTAEDCGPAFPLAAAMTVMDKLSSMVGEGSAGKVASFTAGDLAIRTENSGAVEKSLSSQAEELLAPWLDDTGFCFRGVRG